MCNFKIHIFWEDRKKYDEFCKLFLMLQSIFVKFLLPFQNICTYPIKYRCLHMYVQNALVVKTESLLGMT